MRPGGSFYDAVYRVARKIPEGRVTTYGRIAAAVGSPRASRAVGYALFNLPTGSDVPWHRVINRLGEISNRSHIGRPDLQRRLLEDEGVTFSEAGRVNLKAFVWEPPPDLEDDAFSRL